MATFSWFPTASVQKKVQPRVSVARFGDGYEQRTPVGINNQPEVWSLKFVGNRPETDPIDAFLKARAGVESFDWTTPDGDAKRFVCRAWTKDRESGVMVTISCDFEEVFD